MFIAEWCFSYQGMEYHGMGYCFGRNMGSIWVVENPWLTWLTRVFFRGRMRFSWDLNGMFWWSELGPSSVCWFIRSLEPQKHSKTNWPLAALPFNFLDTIGQAWSDCRLGIPTSKVWNRVAPNQLADAWFMGKLSCELCPKYCFTEYHRVIYVICYILLPVL